LRNKGKGNNNLTEKKMFCIIATDIKPKWVSKEGIFLKKQHDLVLQ